VSWRRECPSRRLPTTSGYLRQALGLPTEFRFQCLDYSDAVRLNPALICTLIRTYQGSGAALRKTTKLTTLSVKRMSKPGLYGDGDGLYLQVAAGGTKAWILRYMRAGRARKMGLGPFPILSLAEARQKAFEGRRSLLQGIDPIDARKAARTEAVAQAAKAFTFAECGKAYIAAHQPGWRNEKHREQWSSTLIRYAFPVIGVLSVAAVDTTLVLKVLEPIWNSKPETASRLRGRIEVILDWAKARGYRDSENPARWRGHLDKLLPAKGKVSSVKHHKAIPYRELPSFMARLRSRAEISAQALEFTILTAARTGETLAAVPHEFDLDRRIWTIPAERMKASKEHRVPLCDRAIEIISLQRHNYKFAFPGAKLDASLSNMAMLEMLRGMVGIGFTVHGFRSAFMDWGHEVTNYPKEMMDIALAHTVSDKVEAAYRRGDMFDKRRQLMADWQRYCFSKEDV
jgi:integrase